MRIYQHHFKAAVKVARIEKSPHELVFRYSYTNPIIKYSFTLSALVRPASKLIEVSHWENKSGFSKSFTDIKEAAEYCNLLISDFYSVLKTNGQRIMI